LYARGMNIKMCEKGMITQKCINKDYIWRRYSSYSCFNIQKKRVLGTYIL
jgi:hypothetical protein